MKKKIRLSPFIISLGMTFSLGAQALTLGKMTVLSFLGQPLVAEIEIPEISPEESNSIRVGLASPEAFKSAGLDYTPATSQISVAGKRRADGRAILELRSSQPMSAPFVDVVLEVIWNNGRMLRDYTVLLDPPASANQPLVVPAVTLPIASISVAPSAQSLVNPAPVAPVAPASPASPAATSPVAMPTALQTAALAQLTPASVAIAPKSIPLPNVSAASPPRPSVTTKRGDTAVAIATSMKPEGVSLDQMLIAMLRGNPDAFVAGNINRLKAGVVIEAPTDAKVSAIAPSDARNSIQAQARDFNEYRRKLSSNVATADDGQPARSASGKVVASVADRAAAAQADDRLTLAKPNTTNKTTTATAETKIAQDRANADASARSAELQKNISDLNKISATAQAKPPVAASSAPVAPVVPAASAPVPAVVAAKPPVTAPTPAPQPPQESFLDQLIASSWTLPATAGVGLFALIAGWLAIRRRRTPTFGATQNTKRDFSGTLQPSDTIFGPMGASDVDTKVSPISTTMVYPPTQSSASVVGGVDPIAEADVYLAYNRDVQAEEILNAAKIDSPTRIDIRVKLLELYVARRDVDSFNLGAQELYQLTDGAGSDWSKVKQLAKEIGTLHPLFSAAPPVTSAAQPELAIETSTAHTGLIDFEPNAFALNLPEFSESKPIQAAPIPDVKPDLMTMFTTTMSPTEDPKLALAEEYVAIGDLIGARALINEVIARNTNPQIVTQAQKMLATLG